MNNKKNYTGLILFGVIVLLFFSCSEKEILSEEKFIEIYVDILVAQDTLSEESVNMDSLNTIILNRHKTSDLVYRNTVNYYNESAERWEQFFDKVVVYVEALKTKNEE